jgi:hypothetical protein
VRTNPKITFGIRLDNIIVFEDSFVFWGFDCTFGRLVDNSIQSADSQDNGHGKRVLPELNRLHEAFKLIQVFHLASYSSQDPQPTRHPSPILSQRRLTHQLTKHWPQFKALRHHYASTRFEQQRQFHLPQKHKASVAESSLRVEMNALEEQADNAKAATFIGSPLHGSGPSPSSANNASDPNLWATFVSTMLDLVIPSLSSLPHHHNNRLAKCCCKKHYMDFHGDHTSTCIAHSGNMEMGFFCLLFSLGLLSLLSLLLNKSSC